MATCKHGQPPETLGGYFLLSAGPSEILLNLKQKHGIEMESNARSLEPRRPVNRLLKKLCRDIFGFPLSPLKLFPDQDLKRVVVPTKARVLPGGSFHTTQRGAIVRVFFKI